MPTAPDIIESLKSRFGELAVSEFRDQTRVVIPQDKIYDVCEFLKSSQRFDLLVDVTCVDYLNYRDATDRFGLVYLLASTTRNQRITLRVMLNEPNLTVRSITPLYAGGNWIEREVFDMFGIRFDGHPDHRRILMPDEFTAFPLRKDYPLQGRGERHNFTRIERSDA